MLLITLLESDVIAFRPCFLHLQCKVFQNPFPEVHLSLQSRSPSSHVSRILSPNSLLPNSLNGMLTHSGFTAKVWTLWKGLDHVEFLISKHFVTAEAFCSNDSMNSLTEFAICSLPNSPGELARRGYLERVQYYVEFTPVHLGQSSIRVNALMTQSSLEACSSRKELPQTHVHLITRSAYSPNLYNLRNPGLLQVLSRGGVVV